MDRDFPLQTPPVRKVSLQCLIALPDLLANLTDKRRDPKISTFDVVNSLFHTAVLRIPSINALEGDLKESDFQKLIGRQPTQESVKAFSADVVANVLDKLHLNRVRAAIEEVIHKAERNKAFRDGCYSALRCVAIDGWEPFASYDRHCPHCLVRKVKVKCGREIKEVDEYYHSYVWPCFSARASMSILVSHPCATRRHVAISIGACGTRGRPDRRTASYRFLTAIYGRLIDALAMDALYANGPVIFQLISADYGGFVVLKKDNNEPLKEALALWQEQGPCEQYQDADKKEHLHFGTIDVTS